ncbi:MAG TPA: S41 family peptidase [Candidatus Moranbacteria bacterium]|nr:S41 family peptidase [Candidatus Moranbacteria bacterium]
MENENSAPRPIFENSLARKVFGFFAALAMIAAVFWSGYERGVQNASVGGGTVPLSESVVTGKSDTVVKVDFALFWRVWDLLKQKYVDTDSLDAKKLMYGAIKGMLAATGDPYTTFLDPEETQEFGEDISGSFEGIGAELGIKQGILTVIAPLSGTPAEKAGLRAADKIIRIDGKITADMGIDDAVKLIRGKKGTTVTLTILRGGENEARDITVERGVINVKSVQLSFTDDNIANLKVTRFGDDTSREFAQAIRSLKSRNAKGIILDLRNNPGGYLDSAVDMAGRMLPQGKVVVMEESRGGEREELQASGADMASSIETVVLINEGSASASEILAGALKENRGNVTLVGKKSFGKGSVQELVELPQGTAAKFTVARWLTPNGNQINEQGINPDIEISLSNEDYENDRDPQLDKALEVLREKSVN